MKQLHTQGRTRSTNRYWIVSLLILVVVVGAGAYMFGRHNMAVVRNVSQAHQAPKQIAKLPEADAKAQTTQTAAAHCSNNSSGKLLLVSISTQHLWACDGTSLANESAVTTGTTQIVNGVNDATPTGTWHIFSKQTNRHLTGCDANGCWNDVVAYWMPFDGSVGFHDASWQTFPFGASDYHTDGSHGCVHLPTDFIAWLYDWAPVGTTVTVEA